MRHLQLFVLLALFVASCKNQTTDKSAQKHSDDTTKENRSTVNTKATKPDSLNGDFFNFWQGFRAAVLNFDTAQIIEQTEFPFLTRGSLDSDPTIEYSKKKFVRVFTAYLSQWNGIDPEGSTELDIIKKTELPGKNDFQKDYARIGDLVFDKQGNTWKLVFAYLNDDTIESLKK